MSNLEMDNLEYTVLRCNINSCYPYIYQCVQHFIPCRIQQLQLLGREMRGEIRDKLWRQLESEILLHRHKAVIRACRSKGNGAGGDNTIRASEPPLHDNRSQQGIDEPRLVTVQRETGEGLGISITVSTCVTLVTSFSSPCSFPQLVLALSIKLYDKNVNYIGCEALTAVVMKSSTFWDIMPCSPLKVD
jgi:hypothetical protein